MIWKVRKGTEEQVRELFHNYGRPDHVIKDDDGNEIGLLVSTQVFMRENTIVRVIEADAPSFIDVGKHMRKQQAIQDLETKLDPFLEEPRDMSTPQGAAQFFMSTMMECLVVRRHDE
ncbi:MAG: hypothetical protein QOJ07_2350 [Thermoleophilaceae bacterium]|nr:hypothetical protein [Thermoleophilaceae bacterium]